MQCVRCSQPLPPRADRCLRCFALNPQNSPEPLPSATPASLEPLRSQGPAAPLGSFGSLPSMETRPLAISFESDPPPRKGSLDMLGALSIHSEPPPRNAVHAAHAEPAKPLGAASLELEFPEPELPGFSSQSASARPARGLPRDSPALPIGDPDPTPPPWIDAPKRPPFPNPFAEKKAAGNSLESRAAAPVAAQRSIDRLARDALFASDRDLPIAQPSALPLHAASDLSRERLPDLPADSQPPTTISLPRPSGVSISARLAAWALDAVLIAAVCALFVGLAALQLGGRRLAPLGAQSWESWADGLLFAHRLPIVWALLCASIGLGYSWLFAALGGRTPGLRALGLRLLREDGEAIDPVQAMLRAAIALPSAALGLFGFILALVDPRGQTLHDKLSRSVVVSAAARRESR